MKKININNIADLAVGITFRTRLPIGIPEGLRIVQMKDLSDTSVKTETLSRLDHASESKASFLEPKDIIFRSRGQTTTAVIVPENIGEAVLSGPLFRIRVIDESRVVPEYLCWYINQTPAQIFFSRMAEGSVLKMVSMKDLKSLEIPLPSLRVQSKISKISDMFQEENILVTKIMQKRTQYIENVLLGLLRGRIQMNSTTKEDITNEH